MWGMTVEADSGDVLVVMKIDDGGKEIKFYGNTILSFYMKLMLYCENNEDDPDSVQWFQELEENVSLDLCSQGELFWTSIISGDMNLSSTQLLKTKFWNGLCSKNGRWHPE
jgi:hypothetical protein